MPLWRSSCISSKITVRIAMLGQYLLPAAQQQVVHDVDVALRAARRALGRGSTCTRSAAVRAFARSAQSPAASCAPGAAAPRAAPGMRASAPAAPVPAPFCPGPSRRPAARGAGAQKKGQPLASENRISVAVEDCPGGGVDAAAGLPCAPSRGARRTPARLGQRLLPARRGRVSRNAPAGSAASAS